MSEAPVFITARASEDGMDESVIVHVGHDQVARFATYADRPEDNTCSRMGIAVEVMNLVSSLGHEVRFHQD